MLVHALQSHASSIYTTRLFRSPLLHLLCCDRPSVHVKVRSLQAKEALQSSYFDDLDKETVDALENDSIRAREG